VWALTTHPYLVPSLKKSGVIPLLPFCAFMKLFYDIATRKSLSLENSVTSAGMISEI
jgi:hypothetical protein